MVDLTDEDKQKLKEFLADRDAMSRIMKKITLVAGVIISLAGAWVVLKEFK